MSQPKISTDNFLNGAPKGHLHSSLGDRDNMPLQPESLVLQGAPPVAPPRAQLPMIKVERRPSSACELQTSGLLGYRLEREGKVRECGAAFGCLAELATRRGGLGSPLRAPQVTPQVDLLSPPLRPTSRPTAQQEEDHRSPIERCKPPYSREWLLAHRARCGGSPLRPTALHLYPAELLSLSASATAYAHDAPTASRVVPTHPQPASHACG